jgi:anti-anti-sigma factor
MTMTEPGFPVQVIRGVPVVIAPQEIDITNADRLRAALLQAAARPGAALVVDMTRTRFCDSAGLHAQKPAEGAGHGVLPGDVLEAIV